MIILCVDGLDFDRVMELGLGMFHNKRLVVPRECFGPGGRGPHTLKVWASMFTGQVQDRGHFPGLGSKIFNRVGRILARKRGIHIANWGAPMTYPIHAEKDHVFKNFKSLTWNIPTIDIGWLYALNHWMDMTDYSRQEFMTFTAMALGAPMIPVDVVAIYTRLIDIWGHKNWDQTSWYLAVFELAETLAKKADVLVLSDHGTDEKGRHLAWAYAGATWGITGQDVTDVRAIIEDRINDTD